MKTHMSILTTLIFLLFFVNKNSAQVVNVTIKLPPGENITARELLNIEINNLQTKTIEGKLIVDLKKKNTGIIAEYSSGSFVIPSNKVVISTHKNDELLKLGRTHEDFREIITRDEKLPAGKYEICVRVINTATDQVLSKGCITKKIEEYIAPITLFSPQDGNIVHSQEPYFTWHMKSSDKDFGNVEYVLTIKKKGAFFSCENSFSSRQIWFKSKKLDKKEFTYKNKEKKFKDNARYCWKVDAYSNGEKVGTSDILTFKYETFDE